MECIVLAGGLGTRLKGVIGDIPKCMAPVNDKPFVGYLLQYLQSEGCTKVIFSLGYKYEKLLEWLAGRTYSFAIDYVIEREPLGTGGGIALALEKAENDNVLVLNGDTMFRITLRELLHFHEKNNAETTLALKQMFHFDRYGIVHYNRSHAITAFEEKKAMEEGWINGGIYCINKNRFLQRGFPEKFSFEKDYLEAMVQQGLFYAYTSDNYFIDIGIPQDYNQAQSDFKTLF